jgi:hypothetical protein
MQVQPHERVSISGLRPVAASAAAKPRYAALLDFVAQQAAWWSAVLLVRNGFEAGAALPSLFVVWLAVALRGRTTLLLAALAGALGFVVDTALVQLHAIAFPAAANAQFTSAWMVALWCAFGTAFTESMAWLSARSFVFTAALGGSAGLFAYRAGASLGVLSLGDTPASWVSIIVGWALAISALCVATRRLQHQASQERP